MQKVRICQRQLDKLLAHRDNYLISAIDEDEEAATAGSTVQKGDSSSSSAWTCSMRCKARSHVSRTSGAGSFTRESCNNSKHSGVPIAPSASAACSPLPNYCIRHFATNINNRSFSQPNRHLKRTTVPNAKTATDRHFFSKISVSMH